MNSFAFTGHLTLPSRGASISGNVALGVLAIVSGLVASVSEALDVWDLDDNLTIPIFCGLGLGAFLWVFSGS